jgi:hypothetical protein
MKKALITSTNGLIATHLATTLKYLQGMGASLKVTVGIFKSGLLQDTYQQDCLY